MLFVFVLFISKNTTIFRNASKNSGLVYNGNEKVEDLISRDTDLDGVIDWQESLYGTDPTKADTDDDGVPDNIEIARMTGQNPENGELNLNIDIQEDRTQTGQLSKELFSTLAALNQAGQVDQETIDKLSASLADKIQSSLVERVFTMADLKILKTDTVQDVKNYNDKLNSIYAQYKAELIVPEVLAKFIIDEDTVDDSALLELDIIIKQTNSVTSELIKVGVPKSLTSLHLDFLNKLVRFSENLSNLKFYDSDPILAMGSITQYETDVANLELAANNLTNAINKKLNK